MFTNCNLYYNDDFVRCADYVEAFLVIIDRKFRNLSATLCRKYAKRVNINLCGKLFYK